MKTPKSNQRSKLTANGAKLPPVSKSVRNKMANQITQLNAPPHSFTYEQISAAMGHESGYAHLVQKGGRVAPTKVEAQALDAMYQTAQRYSTLFRNDIDRRVSIIGLCAQVMRKVNEL